MGLPFSGSGSVCVCVCVWRGCMCVCVWGGGGAGAAGVYPTTHTISVKAKWQYINYKRWSYE